MDPATLSMLMPVIEKLLDKFLDLFTKATDNYSQSGNLKQLSEDLTNAVKDKEFLKMAQKYVPGFEINGDVDTAAECDKLIDVFQKMINDPSVSSADRIKLEGIVSKLTEARADFAKEGDKGGENDLQVKGNTSAMPTQPGGSVTPKPPLGTNDLPGGYGTGISPSRA
jgi:hypothetical protein